MAIKKCKECGKEVSTSAKTCPHCGRKYPTGGLTWPAKIFLGLLVIMFLPSIVRNCGSTTTSSSSTPSVSAPSVPKGSNSKSYSPEQMQSAQKVGEYSCEKGYPHVPKKDGTYDNRENDLWELAQDWVYYRNKILVCSRRGDQGGVNKAREAFQDINRWLEAYSEDHVSKALQLAEECR